MKSALSDNPRPRPKLDYHPNWHVVETFANQELRVLENLSNQGFITLCPTFTAQTKRRTVTKRLMPGYVFVAFEQRQHWQPIYHTYGVKRVLEYVRGTPAKLDESLIRNIKQQAADCSLPCQTNKEIEIDAGTELVITEGIYAGHYAICQLCDRKRVQILLHIFGNPSSVTISRKHVAIRQ